MPASKNTTLIQKVLEQEVFQGTPVLLLDWEVENERIKGNLLTLGKEVMSFVISKNGFSYHPNPELQRSLRQPARPTSRTDSGSYVPFAFLEGMIEVRMDSSHKDVCSRGNPCGSTCIQKGDGCGVRSPQAKVAAQKVLSSVVGGSSPANNPQKVKHDPDVQAVIARGEKDTQRIASNPKIQRAVQTYHNSKNKLAAERLRTTALEKAVHEAPSPDAEKRAKRKYVNHHFDILLPSLKKYERAAKAADSLLIPEMEKQRAKMLEQNSGVGEMLAPDGRAIWVNTVDERIDEQVNQELKEVFTMAGGRPMGIKSAGYNPFDDRAFASVPNGLISLGLAGRADVRDSGRSGQSLAKSQVFHEAAHFIESEDPEILSIAERWRDKRGTGEPKLLSELTGLADYKSEVAIPDHFVSPYVGKVYLPQDKATEVISVGVEHFSSPARMAQLYREDSEHFNLTVGILKKNDNH